MQSPSSALQNDIRMFFSLFKLYHLNTGSCAAAFNQSKKHFITVNKLTFIIRCMLRGKQGCTDALYYGTIRQPLKPNLSIDVAPTATTFNFSLIFLSFHTFSMFCIPPLPSLGAMTVIRYNRNLSDVRDLVSVPSSLFSVVAYSEVGNQ